KTPQALAPRRLGRQSAERERISEINWNGFYKKTVGKLAFLRICLKSEVRNVIPSHDFKIRLDYYP
ncbi:hypothetical protein, partial [Peribacillus simplex]|uniref:hypothetical protein n=1 Tax=Peribacillus simplex TaxID=1478 RepID=UPI0036733BFF